MKTKLTDAQLDAMEYDLVQAVTELMRDLTPSIDDDCRAYDDSDDDDGPSMLVTIGIDDDGNWGWETGDTSFTGGAYSFPHWGQVALYRDSDPETAARDAVGEAIESLAYSQT
jgi:hypothetical protein